MSRHRLEDEIKQKYGLPILCWSAVIFPDPSTIDDVAEREKLEKKIRIFEARKCAFDSYFEGTPIADIMYQTENGTLKKLSPAELHRWLKRCLTPKSNGRIYGYEGLIPYHRIEPYIREKALNFQHIDNLGLSGAWADFFNRHESIRKLVFYNYLYGGESNSIRIKAPRTIDIYNQLIRQCKKQKLYDDYPLILDPTAKTKPGLRSFYDYLRKLRTQNYDLYAKTHLTSEAALLAKTAGNGQKLNALPEDMYAEIELDEHKVDGKFIVTAESVQGDVFVDTVDSITIITALDTNTQALWGYNVVPGSNPTAEDIQRCIINCIVPHQLMNFSIHGLEYPDATCFPSLVSDDLQWAIFGQLKFDNAMSHKSAELMKFLTETLKVQVTRGAVRHAVARPHVEKFFDLFERNFTHRMVNTTGGTPNSPKRNDPIGQALKYGITYEDACELIEIALANYNLTPKKSTYGMSPIQAIKSRLSQGRIPQILPTEIRKEATTIVRKVSVQVLGNQDKGRNPYVNYQYARYTSSLFAASKDLLGENITLVIDIDDASYAEAYRSDGSYIDRLFANGSWGVIPHSLQLRKFLNTRRSEGELDFTDQEDFIDVYYQYLIKKGNTFVRAENLVKSNTSKKQIAELDDLMSETQDLVAITDLLPNSAPKVSELQSDESIAALEEMGIFDDIN